MSKEERATVYSVTKKEIDEIVKAGVPDVGKHKNSLNVLEHLTDVCRDVLAKREDKNRYSYVYLIAAISSVVMHIEQCEGRPLNEDENTGIVHLAFSLGRLVEVAPEALEELRKVCAAEFGVLTKEKLISVKAEMDDEDSERTKVSSIDNLVEKLRGKGMNVQVIHLNKDTLGRLGHRSPFDPRD